MINSKFVSTLAIVATLFASFMGSRALANDQLAADMRQMNSDYKLIKAQLGDATKNESTLQTIDDMVKAVDASMAEMPDSVSSLDDAQKSQMLSQYMNMMNGLKAKLAELREDLVNGKNQDAVVVFADIGKIKTQGHMTFEN